MSGGVKKAELDWDGLQTNPYRLAAVEPAGVSPANTGTDPLKLKGYGGLHLPGPGWRRSALVRLEDEWRWSSFL